MVNGLSKVKVKVNNIKMNLIKLLKRKSLNIFEKYVIHKKVVFLDEYTNVSYSQEGEDVLLNELFLKQKRGFFVDVGAHHPVRFSNTFRLYMKGWSGINIEPLKEVNSLFENIRPRDINLSVGIAKEPGELTYYVFKEAALNTFNKENAYAFHNDDSNNHQIIETQTIKVETLENIFQTYAKDKKIDVLSIDVEKFELEVLQSNNWEKYRPELILVEILDFDLDTINQNRIHQYLINIDYKFFAKTQKTCFYKNIR